LYPVQSNMATGRITFLSTDTKARQHEPMLRYEWQQLLHLVTPKVWITPSCHPLQWQNAFIYNVSPILLASEHHIPLPISDLILTYLLSCTVSKI